MFALDFEYDNQYLSSFGFIVCNFDYSTGATEVSAGSNIAFNKVPRMQGKNHSLTSTQYDECITATFDICKNPEIYELDQMEIDDDEYRDLVRWLNRREFLDFCVISDGESEHDICYYHASFNATEIRINEKIYGIRLIMETDKPFGFGKERSVTWATTNPQTAKTVVDASDDIGEIYPTVIIKCNANGDLTLHNDFCNCTTVIKNCKQNEVITLHGDTQIITSSLDSHNICKDFNYEFFRIGNTYADRRNKITASIPCSITIKYQPIIRDIP